MSEEDRYSQLPKELQDLIHFIIKDSDNRDYEWFCYRLTSPDDESIEDTFIQAFQYVINSLRWELEFMEGQQKTYHDIIETYKKSYSKKKLHQILEYTKNEFLADFQARYKRKPHSSFLE